MIEQFAIIVVFALAVLFLSWIEYRRNNKKHREWRLLSVMLLIASAYLILCPFYWNQKVRRSSQKAIILTESYSADSLKKLKGMPVYSISESDRFKKKFRFIPDLQVFLAGQPAIRELYILGNGLPERQLKLLSGIRVNYLPGRRPEGVTTLNWTSVVQQGAVFRVRGRYYNSGKKTQKLALQVFGKSVDSIKVNRDSTLEFEFKYDPKHLGKASYSLLSISESDTLSDDPLPFEVIPAEKLKVIMLASSPGFEYRFLKDWLKAGGQEVRIRTRISRNKFSAESTGLNSAIGSITESLLNGTDLLIADPVEIASLSSYEQQNIQKALRKGLGIILHGNLAQQSHNFLRNHFQTRPFHTNSKTMKFSIEGTSLNQELSDDGETEYILASSHIQPIIKESSGRTLSALKLVGSGKLLLNRVPETFPWKLSGNEDAYGLFWSRLIKQSSRSSGSPIEVFSIEQFPLVGQQSTWMIKSPEFRPAVSLGGIPLAIGQDELFATRWKTEIWGKREGWDEIAIRNNLQVDSTQKASIYFYRKGDWVGARSSWLISQNRNFARNQNLVIEQDQEKLTLQRRSAPAIYFYLIFILCCGFLWLEPKLL